MSTPAVTHNMLSSQAARIASTKNLTSPNVPESSPLEGVHTALDAAGYVPTVGDLADLINGVIYAAEGDWFNALTSAAAIFIDGATAGRLGAKASKEIIEDAIETVATKAVKNGSGKIAGEITENIGEEIAEEVWDQISEYINEDENGRNAEHMLGANGTQVSSKTTWQNGKTERIDVENPSPGERPGQVHYHDSNNNKYYYDKDKNAFYDQKTGELAPTSIQNLLKDKEFMKGIKKALQILGE